MADFSPTPTGTDAQAPPEDIEVPSGPGLVGSVVADRYRVERLLGEGAMGAVYQAQHVHMHKAVALKVLHQWMSQNPEVVRRFEREAIAAARIEHPGVASASDFGRLSDGSFYLVLEFINGKSLGQLIEELGALSPERTCRIGAQIAAALSAAHEAGIVHRDLKPENVMMPQVDPEAGDVVKVLDFGMAKLQQGDNTETKLTAHGAVYGTPQYMAPEQAAGQEVDQRADVYALGVMLYEMLSGRPPFSADNMMALLVKHMTERPERLPAAVPRPLADLVMQCLEKKPDDRPQTAAEVFERLTEFLGAPYQDPRLSAVGIPAPRAQGRDTVPSVVALRVADKVAPWVERLMPIYGKVERATRPIFDFFKRPVSILGRKVPRWALVFLGFGFVSTWLLVSSHTGSASDAVGVEMTQPSGSGVPRPTRDIVAKADPHPPDPELAKVIREAEAGSESALYALLQRDDGDRSLTEWLGLTKALLIRKKVKPALDAFHHALEIDPAAAYDAKILGALRHLVDQEQYARPIIDFAANELGKIGADFLFHVWFKTSLKTTATTLAYEKLEEPSVQERFSPALAVAMQLREAQSCEDFKKLLPTIERVGDDRTLTKLRPLERRHGCGANEQNDCYPCLRKDDALRTAMQSAAMRKSPQFELHGFKFKR